MLLSRGSKCDFLGAITVLRATPWGAISVLSATLVKAGICNLEGILNHNIVYLEDAQISSNRYYIFFLQAQ